MMEPCGSIPNSQKLTCTIRRPQSSHLLVEHKSARQTIYNGDREVESPQFDQLMPYPLATPITYLLVGFTLFLNFSFKQKTSN